MVNTSHRRMAILSAGDPRNPRRWSGIPYFMARALTACFGDVAFVGPLNTSILTFMKFVDCGVRTVSGCQLLPRHSLLTARRYARLAEARIPRLAADVIVAPAGSALVPFLRTALPIVYTSDTTARLMFDYYPEFTNATSRARQRADELERRTIARANLLIYPTEWAAHSAIEDYGADPAKVHVLPYGANIPEPPARDLALAPRKRPGCKLIFIGVSWARKGGAIAVEALRILRQRGVDAQLTIVGCVPPRPIQDSAVTVIPFLDKNDPIQFDRLKTLYLEADFLILPTRSECYGIVFCEAAAHGVPSIATATGGVPEVVRDGISGYTIPLSAGPADYAAVIEAILEEPARLDRLRESARDHFERRVNWDTWARATSGLVDELLDPLAAQTASLATSTDVPAGTSIGHNGACRREYAASQRA